jgi:hypothetical protein
MRPPAFPLPPAPVTQGDITLTQRGSTAKPLVAGTDRSAGAFVVLRGHSGEHAPQISGEARQPLLRRRVDDVQVDGPVAVHDSVAQAGRLAPSDLSELSLELIRQLRSGFAEHGEVPRERVAADPICSQVLDRDTLANATAWTAAWIISSRSRTSRRIQGLSLRQYRFA